MWILLLSSSGLLGALTYLLLHRNDPAPAPADAADPDAAEPDAHTQATPDLGTDTKTTTASP